MDSLCFLENDEELILTKIPSLQEKIKKRVIKQDLVKKLINIINKSKSFSFKNKRLKKSLESSHPLFILKTTNVTNINKNIYNEIISKECNVINDSLKNFSLIKEEPLLNNNVFLKFLLSSFFNFFQDKDGIIYLEFKI